MRKKWLVANWKMNGNGAFVKEWHHSFASLGSYGISDVSIVVCPPFPYLILAKDIFSACADNSLPIQVGAQNVCDQPLGAYTGEVSASMLTDLGISFVIIGHSERRQFYGESDQMIARKIQLALAEKITPILCVGEMLSERENGLTQEVLHQQLTSVFDLIGLDAFSQLILAYEPVWAIGTGKTATAELAAETHALIRAIIRRSNVALAEKLSILYGGSLKPENAAELFAQNEIDGGLVGGASLMPQDFALIARAFNIV